MNDMLLIAASMLGGFVFAALLSEDVDDDDGPDGGLMTPVCTNTKLILDPLHSVEGLFLCLEIKSV